MLRTSRIASLQGELRPPSDKSLTHRALMLGAIAAGESRIRSPLDSQDCRATHRCLQALGAELEWNGEIVRIHGGKDWKSPTNPLDCGNSGTTMRLLSGLIASRPIRAELDGDASLRRRPMARIRRPLHEMGADFVGDTPPIAIQGGKLHGIDYASPVSSAQVKSCVLLAGLGAEGRTVVTEPEKSRDHTERMLRACGVDLTENGCSVALVGGQTVQPFQFDVPADISGAAFWMVASMIVPSSRVLLKDVGVNPTRTGIFEIFKQAGLRFIVHDERGCLGEPVADVEVEEAGIGLSFEIDSGLAPRLIDEIPILAVLATQLDGVSRIRGANELRVKESDRIEAVATALRAMGAEVETYEDGMDIGGPTRLRGATIDANHDHRIAMAFAIAGLIAEGETNVLGSETIASSYPEFEKHLWSVAVV